MLNRSASLAMSTSVFKALPGKLDVKRHSPGILFLWAIFYNQASITVYSKRSCFVVYSCILETTVTHVQGAESRSDCSPWRIGLKQFVSTFKLIWKFFSRRFRQTTIQPGCSRKRNQIHRLLNTQLQMWFSESAAEKVAFWKWSRKHRLLKTLYTENNICKKRSWTTV